MAILFEWYENPVAPNQPQEETKLHARITLNGKQELTDCDANPGTLFTDGNRCIRRARRSVSCDG